jgi:hypothetical protein
VNADRSSWRNPPGASESAHATTLFQEGILLLDFAEACIAHSLHTTAFLFLTLWCEDQTNSSIDGLASLLNRVAGNFLLGGLPRFMFVAGPASTEETDQNRFQQLLIKSTSHSLDSDLLLIPFLYYPLRDSKFM